MTSILKPIAWMIAGVVVAGIGAEAVEWFGIWRAIRKEANGE